jgi:ribosome modulation factor
MAIANNTPRGEGYLAALYGKSHTDNPYWKLDTICQGEEWLSGWTQAMCEGLCSTKKQEKPHESR